MEFNEEDKKWILEAKELEFEPNQIAKILNVNVNYVIAFLDSVALEIQPKIKATRIYNKDKSIKDLVTKKFIKNQIRKGISLNKTAKALGLVNFHQLSWVLKKKRLSWKKLAKEVFQELKRKAKLNTNEIKKCPKCNQLKGFSLFYKDIQTLTGHSSWCKECHSKEMKSRRLKIKAISNT